MRPLTIWLSLFPEAPAGGAGLTTCQTSWKQERGPTEPHQDCWKVVQARTVCVQGNQNAQTRLVEPLRKATNQKKAF